MWDDEISTARYPPKILLCGSVAYFDEGSGCSYRCSYCSATVGSVSMPKRCQELYQMEEVVDKLKGKKVNHD